MLILIVLYLVGFVLMLNSMLDQYLRRFGMIYDLDLLTAFMISIFCNTMLLFLFKCQEIKKNIKRII